MQVSQGFRSVTESAHTIDVHTPQDGEILLWRRAHAEHGNICQHDRNLWAAQECVKHVSFVFEQAVASAAQQLLAFVLSVRVHLQSETEKYHMKTKRVEQQRQQISDRNERAHL